MKFLAAGLIVLGTAFWCKADDDPSKRRKAEPVVVTVSSQAIPLSAASASVTVLTSEFIESTRAESVIEVLRVVPFIHISQVGGRGGLSTVTLRGGDPNFVLVMIDGIPMNDPTNLLGGSYDFSNLSTDHIERIEIVRGPLSSLYGSEAMSGVINIISRHESGETAYSGEGSVGNLSSGEVRAEAAGRLRKFHYSFSGSYFETSEQVENDSFQLGTLAFQSEVDLGKGKLLNLVSRYNDSDAKGFPENGGGPEFSILRDPKITDSQEFVFGIQYGQQQSQSWSFNVGWDFYNRDSNMNAPAILDQIPPSERSLPSFQDQTDFTRQHLQFESNWNLREFAVSAGVGWKDEEGKSNGVIADFFPSEFSLSRTTKSANGELLFNSRGWNATAGLRIDDTEDFDTEWSPRLGISYRVANTGTRFKATWGDGFKLPSFLALGDPNIGNPELQPEHSRGFDIGAEQDFFSARVQLSLTYFHNSFRDLIDFSAEEFRLVNRSLVTTRGFELEGKAQLAPNFLWGAHVAFVDADIAGSDEPLRDRPRWRGGMNVQWGPSKDARLQFNILWVGDRFDFQLPVPERNIAESYATADLAFSYHLPYGLTAFTRIDNITNNHYQEFVGFPNPGRIMRFGLRFSSDRR